MLSMCSICSGTCAAQRANRRSSRNNRRKQKNDRASASANSDDDAQREHEHSTADRRVHQVRAPFDDDHLGRDDHEEREAQLVAALPSFDSTFVNSAFLYFMSFWYSNDFVAKYNKIWIARRERYDKLSNFCKRVFWFFHSLKNTMLEEEETARSRFSKIVNNIWLASLLDLADLKHTPKKAGDCWLAGEALDNRLERSSLLHEKYQQ